MSSFTKPFKVLVHNNSLKDKPFEVIVPFEYYSKKFNGFMVKVPKGYRTDFASVPRIFWAIIPPIGKYSKACVIHDVLIDNKDSHEFTMDEINQILFEAMGVLCVSKFNKYLIYGSVLFYWKFGRYISNFVRKILRRENGK